VIGSAPSAAQSRGARQSVRVSGMADRAIRSVAAAAVVLTLVAGCSSAGAAAGASPVATSQVDLPASYRFAPPAIVVKAGTTVTWTNHDHFTHSVQFLDGGLPTAPLVMEPGQSATFTFAGAGTFSYQCHFHPQNMKGTVTVTS
jgi:plastocyanin